jgi:alkylation response protein AidB-like acyl-CoA dehydrogenase
MTTTGAAVENLVAAARKFAARAVLPHAPAWEHARRQPLATLREAASLGFAGIEVPVALGGRGLGFSAKLRVAEVLSGACMGFAFSLTNLANCAMRVATWGNDTHRARYLADLLRGARLGGTAITEPGMGSDVGAIATTARPVADGWILDGEKAWITNAAHGDVFFTYAQTEPGSGTKGIACFLVDGTRPGFTRTKPPALMGGHAIGAAGFVLDGYRADAADMVQPPGRAFRAAMAGINGARTYVAGMCCGMLEASLAAAVDYALERRAFGVALLDQPVVAAKLAGAATTLAAMRALTREAAAVIEAGGDAALPAALAKKFAGETIVAALSDCMQAMGAAGLREDVPIGRHIALGRIANYVDGTTEMQTRLIAASLRG